MSPRPGPAIGLDVGATKIAGGVVTLEGEVVERLPPVATPSSDQNAIIATIHRITDELRARHRDVSAIGIGVPGIIDWPQGWIRWAPNSAFRHLPLRDLVQKATGLPTIVDNDANVAAWAETRSGDRSHMAFLTVGTGVGGGLIVNGELYRGRTGIAAEVGHLIVDPQGGVRCGCGNVGCLEAMASGTALGRYGQETAAVDPDSAIARLVGGRPEQVTGRVVLEAARTGDVIARGLFERLGYWLGVGIATLVNLFDFEFIVIGGGLVTADNLLLDPTRTAFGRFLFAAEHRDFPEIVPATLGTEAGWIGAGLLSLELRGAGAEPVTRSAWVPPDEPVRSLAR